MLLIQLNVLLGICSPFVNRVGQIQLNVLLGICSRPIHNNQPFVNQVDQSKDELMSLLLHFVHVVIVLDFVVQSKDELTLQIQLNVLLGTCGLPIHNNQPFVNRVDHQSKDELMLVQVHFVHDAVFSLPVLCPNLIENNACF